MVRSWLSGLGFGGSNNAPTPSSSTGIVDRSLDFMRNAAKNVSKSVESFSNTPEIKETINEMRSSMSPLLEKTAGALSHIPGLSSLNRYRNTKKTPDIQGEPCSIESYGEAIPCPAYLRTSEKTPLELENDQKTTHVMLRQKNIQKDETTGTYNIKTSDGKEYMYNEKNTILTTPQGTDLDIQYTKLKPAGEDVTRTVLSRNNDVIGFILNDGVSGDMKGYGKIAAEKTANYLEQEVINLRAQEQQERLPLNDIIIRLQKSLHAANGLLFRTAVDKGLVLNNQNKDVATATKCVYISPRHNVMIVVGMGDIRFYEVANEACHLIIPMDDSLNELLHQDNPLSLLKLSPQKEQQLIARIQEILIRTGKIEKVKTDPVLEPYLKRMKTLYIRKDGHTQSVYDCLIGLIEISRTPNFMKAVENPLGAKTCSFEKFSKNILQTTVIPLKKGQEFIATSDGIPLEAIEKVLKNNNNTTPRQQCDSIIAESLEIAERKAKRNQDPDLDDMSVQIIKTTEKDHNLHETREFNIQKDFNANGLLSKNETGTLAYEKDTVIEALPATPENIRILLAKMSNSLRMLNQMENSTLDYGEMVNILISICQNFQLHLINLQNPIGKTAGSIQIARERGEKLIKMLEERSHVSPDDKYSAGIIEIEEIVSDLDQGLDQKETRAEDVQDQTRLSIGNLFDTTLKKAIGFGLAGALTTFVIYNYLAGEKRESISQPSVAQPGQEVGTKPVVPKKEETPSMKEKPSFTQRVVSSYIASNDPNATMWETATAMAEKENKNRSEANEALNSDFINLPDETIQQLAKNAHKHHIMRKLPSIALFLRESGYRHTSTLPVMVMQAAKHGEIPVDPEQRKTLVNALLWRQEKPELEKLFDPKNTATDINKDQQNSISEKSSKPDQDKTAQSLDNTPTNDGDTSIPYSIAPTSHLSTKHHAQHASIKKAIENGLTKPGSFAQIAWKVRKRFPELNAERLKKLSALATRLEENSMEINQLKPLDLLDLRLVADIYNESVRKA